MSVSIPAMPSAMPVYRFDGPAAPVQSPLPEPAGVPETGFDGHMKVPDYFALWLELLELTQERRAVDWALASKAGLLAQDMSRAQAQHVRDEGTHIFAGALAGAVMGLAIGTVGAVISHRAFGKQVGNSARQDGLGGHERPVSDVDVNAPAPLPATRPRELSDDVLEWRSLERRGVSGSELATRPRELSDDVLEWRSLERRSVSGSELATRPRELSDDVLEWRSLERRGVSGSEHSVRSRELRDDVSEMEPLERCSFSGSVRNIERESRTSVSSRVSARGDSEVVDGHDNVDVANVDVANVGAPDHPGNPPFSYETRQVAGGGLLGQMLMANTASLAAIGAAGGQMVAAMDRANSGLTQTSGMISESTKHNRGEEARLGNEAATRALSGLRGMNEDLRQTLSQIISSIKA